MIPLVIWIKYSRNQPKKSLMQLKKSSCFLQFFGMFDILEISKYIQSFKFEKIECDFFFSKKTSREYISRSTYNNKYKVSCYYARINLAVEQSLFTLFFRKKLPRHSSYILKACWLMMKPCVGYLWRVCVFIKKTPLKTR